jgi:hypothetical protein
MDLMNWMSGLAWGSVVLAAVGLALLHRAPEVLATTAEEYRDLSRKFRRWTGVLGAIFVLLIVTTVPLVKFGTTEPATYTFRVFLPTVILVAIAWVGFASLARTIERRHDKTLSGLR